MWAFLADILGRVLTAIGLYEAGVAKDKAANLAAAEAATITNLQSREAIDASVNVDPDLVARAMAAGLVRPDPAAK